ncbi:hypothetical protein JXR93_08430 [bacterium]|nr:hypothetical protein [bacterium]
MFDSLLSILEIFKNKTNTNSYNQDLTYNNTRYENLNNTQQTTFNNNKALFWGNRSEYSKSIIKEQVYDVALNLYRSGIEFDEENSHWMVIPDYKLPANWHNIAKKCRLMVLFPTEYPKIPPIGFYMDANIPQSPDGHFFNDAYHDADKEPIKHGWKWYCVYIKPNSWRPKRVKYSGDWKYGDNLWTYLTLIKEVLSNPN